MARESALTITKLTQNQLTILTTDITPSLTQAGCRY